MDFMEFIEYRIPLLGVTVFQILSALLVLIIGILAIKVIVSMMKRGLIKGKMPKIMADFLSKFVSAILYVAVFMFALGTLGIQVGSVFIGLSAGLGLIIAFGMQDTLNNMFSGVWIATLRPIKAGMALMRKNKMVLKDPAPDVVVTELADSAITLQFRAWTKTDNYWPLKGWLTKKIPEEFGRKGIEIPFPQLDVHMDR